MSEPKLSPKRLLLISLGSAFGGAEKVLLANAQQLSKRYALYFLTLSEGAFTNYLRKNNFAVTCLKLGLDQLNIHRSDSLLWLLNKYLQISKGYRISLSQVLREKQIDIIYVNSIIPAFLTPKYPGLFSIWHLHDIFYGWIRRSLVNLVSFKYAAVVACSHAVKKQFWRGSQVTVIYNDVSFPDLQLKTKPKFKADLCFGVIGRITPDKGVREIIQVFKAVQKQFPKIRLFIFGESTLSNKDYYEEIANSAARSPNVYLKGHERELDTIYSQVAVVINNSRMEALSLGLLEALKCGKVILASKIPGNQEIITTEHNGLLFRGPRGLAVAMQKILTSPQLFNNLSTKALNSYQKLLQQQKRKHLNFTEWLNKNYQIKVR